jgi:signal transduction histidine kinase
MVKSNPGDEIETDIDAIGRIAIVPSLLEVICRTTGMGFAAIARVTDEKWVACSVRDEILFGLEPGGELVLETTICNEIRQHQEPIVIDHVSKNDQFASHPTPLLYGFQSYISVPIIRRNGSFFGTLCAIDPKPAKVNNTETIGMFKLFAELISFHLNAIEELVLSETKLKEEQRLAEVRDQFIAILGHDLRNPISAIMMSAELLAESKSEDQIKQAIKIVKDSAYRMSGLVSNILDFARGRLGDGITLEYKKDGKLVDILGQVVSELRAVYPGSIITTTFQLDHFVECDGNRIAQLFSNLLGNAITYGKEHAPISVHATSDERNFILSVENYGIEIPSATIQQIFQPFYRGNDHSGKKGLGLGLYISAEIAKAHGGTISVSSYNKHTSFTLQMPVEKPVK